MLKENTNREIYLLGLWTFLIVVVLQNEPILSRNVSIYFFRFNKLESNGRTLWSSRQSQTHSQDVSVIQPQLVARYYYKAQKHSNANCNMPSSEPSLRTNQPFLCVKTEYFATVPTSACRVLAGQFEQCGFLLNICHKCEPGHSEQSVLSPAFIKCHYS